MTSGLAVWLFQSGNELTVGASGLIFGYFGYVLVRGFVDRNFADIGVGLVAGVLYWTILQVAIPGTPGVSWIGHLGGLVGGVAAAWLLRTRNSRPVAATRPRAKSVDDLLRELKEQGSKLRPMIRHTVMFKWTAEATPEQRQAVPAELAALAPNVPSIRGFVTGTDAGLAPGNFDFAVTADFDDEAGFFAYRDDPAHREVIARVIAPITAQRVAVQFNY